MSLWTRLKSAFTPPPSTALHQAPGQAGEVLERLRTVIDPELSIDVVELGLIRSVTIDGETARVVMTLTTRGCPVGPVLQAQVAGAITDGGWTADVQLELDPPWTPEAVSPRGRAALAARG